MFVSFVSEAKKIKKLNENLAHSKSGQNNRCVFLRSDHGKRQTKAEITSLVYSFLGRLSKIIFSTNFYLFVFKAYKNSIVIYIVHNF